MGNPHDYREVMQAAFGFIDKDVDEVLAEHKRRDAERKPARTRATRKSAQEPSTATPRTSEVDKLAALMASAKPRPQPAAE